MLGLMACAAAAENGQAAIDRNVVVCMQEMSDTRVRAATRIGTRIFGEIGVRLDWRGPADCPRTAGAIHVTFSRDAWAPAGNFETSHTLAYALPFEGTRIVILEDRIKLMCSQGRFPLILGYVLAHEIAHILEGVCQHSRGGIMRSRWTSTEFARMIGRGLRFTTDDADLIYAGMAGRVKAGQPAPELHAPELPRTDTWHCASSTTLRPPDAASSNSWCPAFLPAGRP
jgi:hypothetical protein